MDWNNFFAALGSLWPLQQAQSQYPIVLQCQQNPLVIGPNGTLPATMELPGDCDLQIDDWMAWSSHEDYAEFGTMGFRCSVYYGTGDWAINYPATNGVRGELLFGWPGALIGRIGYRPWFIATRGNRGLLSFNVSNLSNVTLTVELALRGHRRGKS